MRARLCLAAILFALLGYGLIKPFYHAGQVRSDRHQVQLAPPAEFFRSCSRDTVSPVHGTFPLTDADVAAFETRLPPFLEASNAHPPRSLDHYFFAYAGVLSNGHRLLYANVAPDFLLDHGVSADRIYGIDVCDGGREFWSIVFDLEQLQFRDPTFNGPA